MDNAQGKRIYYGIVLDNAQLRQDAEQSKNIFRGIGDASKAEASRIDNAFRKIAGAAAAVFSVRQAANFVGSIVRVRGEVEALSISFETLLGGNKQKAHALFSEIRTFAVNTPMMLNDLARGAQMLLSFNIEAERVMPILKQIGDISMGDAQKFNSLTLAFSQMMSTGKLMGQDLLQMINAGFNPLSVISEKTGKSISQLKKEMEAGAISSEMVANAFAAATAEGGKFYGMLEKQSKGINGSISNLKGAIEDMMNDIGAANQDIITGSISAATSVVRHYEEIGEALAVLVATYGTYRAILIATEAVRKSIETVKHSEEAAELYKLLTAEQQAKISKLGLSKASAEYYAAVKAEVIAEMERQTKLAVATKTEIDAARVRLDTAKKEKAAIAEKVAAREAELASAVASGNAKKIEAAQTRLNTAQEQLNTATVTVNTAAREVNSKRAVLDTAVRKANTIETGMNTAAQNANISATNLLSAAKLKLTAVGAKLNAVIKKNPLAVAAAAAVALGYGIHKLNTYQTDAVRVSKSFGAAIDEETSKLDKAYKAIRKAKEGTEERKTAIDNFNHDYGSYLDNLLSEKAAVEDVAAAYDKAKTAVVDYAIEKARESYMSEPLADADKAKTALRSSASKWIDKLGDAGKSGAFMADIDELIRRIEGGEVFSEGAMYQALENAFAKQAGFKDNSYHGVKAKEFALELLREAENLQTAAKEFENFSQAYRKTTVPGNDVPPTFDVTTASLQQLMDRLPKAKEELAALKKAERPDPAAIAAKEQEIGQIEAKTLARERGLSAIKDVKAQIEALQKEQLDYGKDDEEYKSREARIEYLKTKLPETDGQQSKAENEAARIRRETAERTRKIQEYEESVKKQVKQSELDIAQAKIDADEDGFEKEMAQVDLTYKRLIFANQQREAEMVEALRDARALQWENDNPTAKAKGETFDRSTITAADLSPEEKAEIEAYTEVANDFKKKAEADLLKKLLDQYRTYEQSRTKITEEYDKKRKALYKKDGETLRDGVTQGNVDELDRQMNKELSDLDNSIQGSTGLWSSLFEDFAYKSRRTLTDIANNARQVLDYVNNTPVDQMTGKFGMSAEQLKTLKNDVSGLSDAYDRLNRIEQAVNSKNPFLALIKGARNYRESLERIIRAKSQLEKIKDDPDAQIEAVKKAERAVKDAETASEKIKANLKETVDHLGQKMSEAGGAFEQAAASLGNDTLADMGQALSFIGDTASKLASGDYLGAALGLFTSWAEAEGRHKKALEELHRSTIAYQREYNALLHDAAMESSDSLFGERRLIDAKKYYAEVQKQQDLLQARMGDLASGRVVTGHKKTGLFGWGKGKDVYSSLLSIYPELIDRDGKFNASVAESILNTQKLDNNTTQMLSDLIQYSEQAEEAMNALNDIAGEVVGNMASTMTDAIFNAIETGADGWDAFQDSGADAIKALGKMMVQELIISNYLDKYSDDIAEMLGRGDKEGVMDLFGKIATEMPGIYEIAADATQQIYDAAANAGYDMTSGAQRVASQKSDITASQESVDDLKGRFTAIQGHTFDIRDAVNAIAASKTQDLLKIEINTERLHTIDANVFGIREASNLLVANSARMLQHLAGIEDNTSRLHAMDDNISNMRSEMRAELSSVRHTVSDMALKGIALKR